MAVSYDTTREVRTTRVPRQQVEQFLSDMRLSIDANLFIPVNRKKNLVTLSQLGITWNDAKAHIRSMTYANYINGPESDYDPSEPDPLWVFKIKIDNDTIYVKIKICYASIGEVKALSFHFDYI